MVSAGALLALLGTGCTPAAAPPPAPSADPTTVAGFDHREVAVRRAAFCDRIPDEAVAEALAGTGPSATATMSGYESGSRVEVAPGVRDLVHEFGCTFGTGQLTVSGWVFAPPVSRARARELARQPGCTPADSPLDYGDPSVAVVCERAGGGREALFAGLFGDAWLSCSVSTDGPRPEQDELVRRSARWCLAVATAAATPS